MQRWEGTAPGPYQQHAGDFSEVLHFWVGLSILAGAGGDGGGEHSGGGSGAAVGATLLLPWDEAVRWATEADMGPCMVVVQELLQGATEAPSAPSNPSDRDL